MGQASVEYGIVTFAFVGMLLALGLLSQKLQAGLFIDHAIQSASHALAASTTWFCDVFLF